MKTSILQKRYEERKKKSSADYNFKNDESYFLMGMLPLLIIVVTKGRSPDDCSEEIQDFIKSGGFLIFEFDKEGSKSLIEDRIRKNSIGDATREACSTYSRTRLLVATFCSMWLTLAEDKKWITKEESDAVLDHVRLLIWDFEHHKNLTSNHE